MEHNPYMIILITLLIIAILYQLSTLNLATADTAMAYYFVILYILEVAVNNIYETSNETCF